MERARHAAPSRVLVSVVLPTHNRARLLGRAIESVQRQTVDGWEIVCVDDGSTDDTVEVIRAIEDPRVRLIRLPQNRGVSHARNVGIRAAGGDYVAFLDDDNEWLPTMLESLLARAASTAGMPEAVIYSLAYRQHDVTGRLAPPVPVLYEGDVFRHLVRGWNPWLSSTAIHRATLLATGGFDEGLPTFEDYDVLLRLAARGVPFFGVRRPLAIRHEHHGAVLSDNLERLQQGLQVLDRKWRLTLQRREGWVSYRRWRARLSSGIEFVGVRRAMARSERLRAWRRCVAMGRFVPWSLRFVVHALALALLGQHGYERLARLRDGALRALRG